MRKSSQSAWFNPTVSAAREYAEAVLAIAALTLVGRGIHVNYRAFGHVYLLAVILLSLRVGRGPVLLAALFSGAAWSFVFIPPRFSFAVFDFEDSLVLGTYFAVALIAGQLTAQIRTQQKNEHWRERRATALFQLTRDLAAALTLDDAVDSAFKHAGDVLGVPSALFVRDEQGKRKEYMSRFFPSSGRDFTIVDWVWEHRREAGRSTKVFSSAEGFYLPLLSGGEILGVWLLLLPEFSAPAQPGQRELIEGFAAQIALLLAKEQFRASSDREKLLAESERLHRTLFDSVSHELKTPLAVLRSAAENLEHGGDARRGDLILEINTATRRLHHLVANLLNQNRLASGTLRAQVDWCDIRDLLSSARRELASALGTRLVKTQISADMPLFLADAPLMESVIFNLLLNALLYTPPESPLCISAGLERNLDRVFVTITDAGPGLPPEVRENLFQKFQRGSSARAGGLGLGLSIVRGFMQAQGGEVVFSSPEGGGASFTVYLPHASHSTVPIE